MRLQRLAKKWEQSARATTQFGTTWVYLWLSWQSCQFHLCIPVVLRHSWIPGRNFPLARFLFFLPCPCPASGGEGKFNHIKSGIWKSISIFQRPTCPTALFLALVSGRNCTTLWHSKLFTHIYFSYSGSWIYRGGNHCVLRSVLNPLCNTKAEYNLQQTHEYIKE